MMINISLALISIKYLGKRFILNSVKSIVITSLILDLLAPPLIPVYTDSPLLAAVFNGILLQAELTL